MPRMHPHMLRHTFVTTMLDAGVSLRYVQIADPRTTMRYDRARKNLDRDPNYILAAYMASGTCPGRRPVAGPADGRVCGWALLMRAVGTFADCIVERLAQVVFGRLGPNDVPGLLRLELRTWRR